MPGFELTTIDHETSALTTRPWLLAKLLKLLSPQEQLYVSVTIFDGTVVSAYYDHSYWYYDLK